MSGFDWEDPFTEDEAARARAARRAEREERRRARQDSLADKVAEQRAGEAQAPATGVEGAVESEAPPEVPPAATDGHGPPPRVTPPAPPAGPPHGPDTRTVWARRAGAVVPLAGLAVAVVLGAGAVIDRLGGSDAPAPEPKPAKVQELLVPEGLDRRQIAELADEAGLKGDYEKASESVRGFDPARWGAEDPPSLEGFLFPATYELPKRATVRDLIVRQLDAFEGNIRGVDLSYAKSKNLNVYDVLKIASMVEREIQVPEERKLAAAVIYNRLAAGDTLGIDATIRYEDQNYDEQLTESRLAEDTPYNTRVRPGLPPTPIGNPGLASIEAAANPARSDAYFFVVKPGTCGEHVFVATEEEFAQAEAEYQAALEAEGGSPTDCD